MQQIVINGDNLEVLKKYPDNYFDSVVTDPPYGLGKEPDAVELMKDWVEKGYHEIKGTGFMGKEWDAFVPQPLFWKEVFRVLKPGGHCLAFYGTRTYDWGVMAMRFAGFEVRDCIQWLYGSGFPKSHNIALAIDKKEGIIGNRGKAINVGGKGDRNDILTSVSISNGTLQPPYKSENKWDGWGSALKPANEPIVLARKPLEKGLSIAENVLKWGTGGINIDGSRIVTNEDTSRKKSPLKSGSISYVRNDTPLFGGEGHEAGRFPANIILTHHPECECKGIKKVKSVSNYKSKDGYENQSVVFNGQLNSMKSDGYADENGRETVEDWNCHPDCPIKILDEQSGNVGGDTRESKPTYDKSIWGNAKSIESKSLYNDKGGASRFFYVAKASKSERNKGLDGFEEKRSSAYGYEIGLGEKGEGMFKDRNPIKQNFHPTVKPVKLMQYLARLITPPNGKVLDPFCGSGTTGIACKLEAFEFVGIEQDPEYTKIAQARINNWKEEQKPTQATLF